MSTLKLIAEERVKPSPRLTEKVYSVGSAGKLSSILYKRKALKPSSDSQDMTATANVSRSGQHNDRRNVTGRVLSAKEHRLKQLQNQLTDAQYHLNELYRENRLLKSIQRRQDSALQRYEGANGDIPQLLNSHNEELRSLQVRYKQVKLQFREVSQRMKDKDSELFKLTEEHKRLVELSKDSNLGERESLRNQVKELNEKVQKQNEVISSLQRRLMLEEKAHKRQLHMEMTKHKETQLQLANALNHSNQLTSVIEMKEKLIASNNTQKKLFPKINNINTKHVSNNVQDTKIYKQNTSASRYSPKDNISTDTSLDSNLKFSSSSTFSIVGKSLQQENTNNSLVVGENETLQSNERDPHVKTNTSYRDNTELDLNEAIRVGIPNMNILSESDTDPPRSSDEDVRQRVEGMKKHIRKSHRNENEVSFEDVRNIIEMNNKRVSRGTLSITSDDSSNAQFTLQQIDKALSRSISKQSEGKVNEMNKSFLSDVENSDFNNVFKIMGENKQEDEIENSSSRTIERNSDLLTEYLTRRTSDDYDSDDRTLDPQSIKKPLEMNNNSIGNKDLKPDLDNDKKKKLLAALKAIDRGEEQGLVFNASKRNSVSSRKSNQ